jgi:6-phosphogluconolactonase (cycloisomerase 2 family)
LTARPPDGTVASMFAYVGCYTTPERHGRGDGINVYRVDRDGWAHVQLVKDAPNPSWLGLDRQQRTLYAAHGDGETISAFRIDADTGRLDELGSQATGGKNGVRLGVDASNRFVVVANYSSGTVAVLSITADGALGPLTDLVTLRGTPGPHRTEQTTSHPHDVVFDPGGRFIAVPDKGLDAIFVFTLDANGTLRPADPPSVASRRGAGPRHADWHPTRPYLYVLNELDSTITTYRADSERGGLTPLQVITTLPTSFTGNSTTSEIAVACGGRFVYASNRGHDSIVVFGLDEATGVLTPLGWEPTQGRTPRFFAIEPSDTVLCVANQDSDSIVTFTIDGATGGLAPTGQVVRTGSPSSIVFRAVR